MSKFVQSIEVCETNLYYVIKYNNNLLYILYIIDNSNPKVWYEKTLHIKKLRVTQAGSFDK